MATVTKTSKAKPTPKAKAVAPSSRWSNEREIAFLDHLSLSSNVAASERAALLTPGTAYRQRRKSPEFARAWDRALREGYGRLELAMLDRAINGTPVTITHKDGRVEDKIVYSERLETLLYTAHRAAVLGPGEANADSARERLARKLSEMNKRMGGDG